MNRVLSLQAAVTPNEEAIIAAGADALARALTAADDQTWSCDVRFHAAGAAFPQTGEPVILIVSLLHWLSPCDTPWLSLQQSIHATVAALCTSGRTVMIPTILRHVGPVDDWEHARRVRIRIRRLNLLATELSREFGAFIIDFDRVLADIGARRLQTNYLLGGSGARRVAGQSVALCIIANALDELATVEVQTRARDCLIKDLPAVELPLGATSNHLWTVGQGIRRQTAAMTETAQANEMGWVLGQVLKRQISPVEALRKLIAKIGQRGVRAGARRVGGALKRLARSGS